MGMCLQNKCQYVITGIFGDSWKTVQLPQHAILTNMEALTKYRNQVGYATNGHLVIQELINKKNTVDKIIIFTDCQLWNSQHSQQQQKTNNFQHNMRKGQIQGSPLSIAWYHYKKIAPNAKLYIFDLAGYGQTPINVANKDVYLIAGWSDKVFDILHAIENGSNALEEIKKIVV
jgi:hypothetical protein